MNKLIKFYLMIQILSLSAVMGNTEATRTNTPPTIDGMIDDIWLTGLVSVNFAQFSPVVMGQPSVKSEVYFLYDDENAYFAGRFYQNKATISSVRSRRDAELILNGDWAAWNLDPLNNGSSAYFITINPSNAFRDGVYTNEDSEIDVSDTGWDSSIQTATRIEEDYWTVEIRLPLKDISYQKKPIQDWGMLVGRQYAANKEFVISNVGNIDKPFEITNFPKLTGLSGFEFDKSYSMTPYTFGARESSSTGSSASESLNTISNYGLDLRYLPSPGTRVLATIHPDFAQLETDVDVINVSDVPTNFPEKRPFFIESSDMYPGIAVNTRNIGDILVGGKYRRSGESDDLDITGVLETDNTFWFLSNYKRSDNRRYLAEVLGGVRQTDDRSDYNVVTHVVGWMFDKKLAVSNWISTINVPEGKADQWYTWNVIEWKSRTLQTSLIYNTNSTFYNPNKVGINMGSNQIKIYAPVKYIRYSETSRVRKVSTLVRAVRGGLYSHPGLYDLTAKVDISTDIYINDQIGVYQIGIVYNPAVPDHFRYRNTGDETMELPYVDIFGNFGRAPLQQASFVLDVISDQSKRFGGRLLANNIPVRSSNATFTKATVYTRLGRYGIVTYSQSGINIAYSPYQHAFKQTIHRLQTDYNLSERMNLRLIVESNSADQPDQTNGDTQSLNVNLTYAWEYLPGSRLFVGMNQNADNDFEMIEDGYMQRDSQTLFLKLDRLF